MKKFLKNINYSLVCLLSKQEAITMCKYSFSAKFLTKKKLKIFWERNVVQELRGPKGKFLACQE